MATPHTKPITIRFNSATRQRLISRAEKHSQSTADVVRSIVADHLAGNDLEHRIRVSLEEVLNRTRQEIGDTVKRTVEEAILFVIEKQAEDGAFSNDTSTPLQPQDPSERHQAKARTYNRTLLAQGRYDGELTPELKAEAKRLMAVNPGRSLEDCTLHLLNQGWNSSPANW